MIDVRHGDASNEWWIEGTASAHALRGERLAMFPDGRTVRCWSDVVERRGTQRRWLLRAQVFDARGEPDTDVFTLSARPSVCASSFRGVALPERRFALLWTERSRGESVGPALQVFTRVFDLRGFPLGSEHALGPALCTDPASLALTPAARGGYVAAWIGADEDGGAHVRAAAFDELGAARGGVLRVSTQPVDAPCPLHLTRLDGGGFVVSWADRAEARGAPVHTQMFDARGERVGDEYLCSFRG